MTGYCPYSPLLWALELKYGIERAEAIMHYHGAVAQTYIDALPKNYESLPKSYYDEIYRKKMKNYPEYY